MARTRAITPASKADPGTRLRLIEAAGPVFALRGFEHATVREIVAAAGANVAAVNYHFGDKLGLYRSVLEHYASAALAAHPAPDHAAIAADPAAALRSFIAAFLERLFHEGKPAFMSQIIAREMVQPTAAFEHLADVHMRPQMDRLRAVVSLLSGVPDHDVRVRRCAASVIAQCVSYKQCAAAHRVLNPEQLLDAAGRSALADHIAAFSLAGIRAAAGSPPPNGPARRATPPARSKA